MTHTTGEMREGVMRVRMFLPQSKRIKWRAVFGSPESSLGVLRLGKWDTEVRRGRGMNTYSSSNPSEVQQKDFQYNLIPKKQTITQLKLNGINYLQFCVISFWQSHEIPPSALQACVHKTTKSEAGFSSGMYAYRQTRTLYWLQWSDSQIWWPR